MIPVVNTSAMTPTMASALNAVTAQLTTEDLQNMNAQADLERKDPVDVARAWLTEPRHQTSELGRSFAAS